MKKENKEIKERTTVIDTGILPVLKAIDRQNFMVDLEEALDKVVLATQETGKSGKLSIEIEIAPNEKTGAVEVSGGIKIKLPEPSRKAAIFYVTQDNKLSRQAPNQPELFDR